MLSFSLSLVLKLSKFRAGKQWNGDKPTTVIFLLCFCPSCFALPLFTGMKLKGFGVLESQQMC